MVEAAVTCGDLPDSPSLTMPLIEERISRSRRSIRPTGSARSGKAKAERFASRPRRFVWPARPRSRTRNSGHPRPAGRQASRPRLPSSQRWAGKLRVLAWIGSAGHRSLPQATAPRTPSQSAAQRQRRSGATRPGTPGAPQVVAQGRAAPHQPGTGHVASSHTPAVASGPGASGRSRAPLRRPRLFHPSQPGVQPGRPSSRLRRSPRQDRPRSPRRCTSRRPTRPPVASAPSAEPGRSRNPRDAGRAAAGQAGAGQPAVVADPGSQLTRPAHRDCRATCGERGAPAHGHAAVRIRRNRSPHLWPAGPRRVRPRRSRPASLRRGRSFLLRRALHPGRPVAAAAVRRRTRPAAATVTPPTSRYAASGNRCAATDCYAAGAARSRRRRSPRQSASASPRAIEPPAAAVPAPRTVAPSASNAASRASRPPMPLGGPLPKVGLDPDRSGAAARDRGRDDCDGRGRRRPPCRRADRPGRRRSCASRRGCPCGSRFAPRCRAR